MCKKKAPQAERSLLLAVNTACDLSGGACGIDGGACGACGSPCACACGNLSVAFRRSKTSLHPLSE